MFLSPLDPEFELREGVNAESGRDSLTARGPEREDSES